MRPTSPLVNPWRRLVRWRPAVFTACAFALLAAGACWHFAVRPFRDHLAWSTRVRASLRNLADRRPATVPRGQWEYAVGWTLNLHANCASDTRQVSLADLKTFSEQLDKRLGGHVDMSTIDWVWDEYERMTKLGKDYSRKYRPTRSPDLPSAEEGCFGIPVQ